MKYVPKILLIENIVIEDEVNLFLAFLHHPYYVQNRNSILHVFPQLKKLLQTTETEEKAVLLFLKNFYTQNKNLINKAIQRNKNILNQYSNSALIALFDIMTYHYDKPIIYTAIPTILPFSPFKDNSFYFSILGEIKGHVDKNVLVIGIHEISHFIFLKQSKRIENKKGIILSDDVKNYLKEALAVVILNQKPLCSILELKNYKGNQEIQSLKIEKSDGNIKTFTDFLNEYYFIAKIKKQKSFCAFLEEIINILLPITPEFVKKRALWNKYGKKVLKEPELIKLYSKPIRI